MAKLAPIIGQWYQDIEQGQLFEVIAIDDTSGTFAIQYIDGEIGELDYEMWHQIPTLSAEQPEDWSSSFELDMVDQDDSGNINFLRDPLTQIESDSMLDFDELP